ncbi:MAG: holliday junction DNA helicase RuvA [Rhodobacteraceae bacterium HLUCCO18]|nr:MAG: holliday junction DNA helicase RuvA [Rhodobacteraceae bacterium HLUCCO18]
MIGKLSGRLDYIASDHVLLDVSGVGYVVHCSDRTLAALPPKGEAVSLYTELLVREDLLQLFGFLSPYEREWHRLLVSVQGVGAKASMAILGTLGAEGAARAVALGDWSAVRAAPGVGPKLAQRVVNELKDKAPSAMALGGDPGAQDLVVPDGGPTTTTPQRALSGAAQAEALSALQNLGYAPADAARAVAEVAGAAPEADTPGMIRAALRLLAPRE